MLVRVCISECQLTKYGSKADQNGEDYLLTFLGTFSFVPRVARNIKIKPNKHLKFKTKIYQKSNALVRGR